MAPTVGVPNVLTDPGFLLAAPLGSALPANTVTAGKYTDDWPAAWIGAGATTEGSTFNYSSSVEPIRAAEYFDPIRYVTTERAGNIAFNLMDFTLGRLKMAYNGGLGAITATTGTGATASYDLEPPNPGEEVRLMIGWQSLDGTMRLVLRQTIQGGEVSSAFQRPPSVAAIPCTFNMETPIGADKPFKWSSTRG